MIYYNKEFEKKMIDADLNRKLLAEKIGMSPSTLASKLDKPDSEFKISEASRVATELNLTITEFMMIFFNNKIPFDAISSA